jgi:hypothetical protein
MAVIVPVVLLGIFAKTAQSRQSPSVINAVLIGSVLTEPLSIRNVIRMSTGVTFDERIPHFWSINKMGRVLALRSIMDSFAESLDETFVEPDTQWKRVHRHLMA